MNQSYKSIYNEQTGTWVAVSELTQTKGKKSSNKILKQATMIVAIAAVTGMTHAQQIIIGTDTAGDNGTAVAVGVNAVAIGAGSYASASSGVALGASSVANTAAGAAGYNPTTATAADKLAIQATNSTALGAISVGAAGNTRQITNVAAGTVDTDAVNVSQLKAVNNALTKGQTHYYSVNDGGTVGANYNNNGATDINSIAAGVGAVATKRNSVSMGTSASATTAYGVAIGYKATVNATGSMGVSGQSVAIGAEASAGGFSSIAIGGNRDVVGVTTPNYGSPHAMGQGSIAIGAASFAGGRAHSTALGVDARAEVDQSLALGDYTRAQGVRSAAVGTGATVTVADGVALGSYSVANTATGIAGYVPPPADAAQTARIVATNSTLAAVSVGNAANNKFRQITGVAAGTADSDAVNVAQLVAVQGSIAAGKTKYYSVNSTGGGNELNDGATGADAIAAGKNAAAAGDNAVAMGMGATASKNDAVAIGSSSADGVGSVAIGKGASSTEDNNVALGANSVANSKAVQVNDASIPSVIATLNADGTTTYTAGPDIIYSGFAGTASGVVSVGKAGAERQIINVAPGKITANSTDAINGSQLYAIASQVSAIGGSITNIVNNAQTHFYSVNGNNKAGNYANDGATGTNSLAAGVNSTATGDNSTAVGNGSTSAAVSSVAVGDGANVAAAATSGVAIGKGSSVTTAGGVAIGEGSVSSTAGGVAGYVPPPADAAQTASIAATTSTTGSFAVGDASKGVYRQITGVAAGSADSDAVNVAQLKAVQGSIAASATHYYSVNSTDTGAGSNYNNDGAAGTNSIASGAGASVAASATDSIAMGHNATSTIANNVALGANSVDKAAVQVSSATVGGSTYGGFAGTASGVVSVGDAGAERQIVNVAPGAINSTSTDAINGSQLYSVAENIDNRITNIDERVTNIDNSISGLKGDIKKAYAGTAMAMALQTPQFVPGKTTYAISLGQFQSETALGVSLRRSSDTGRFSWAAGVAGSRRGGVGGHITFTGTID